MSKTLNPFKAVVRWLMNVGYAWAREMRAVFTDPGVLIFFFALPTLYPIVYTLIYNPEIVTEMPVAVVDNSRTAASRELVRQIGATQSVDIIGYASDMGEARRWYADGACMAIVEIPSDYAKRLGRNEQAVVPFYCDMTLLLRYRALLLTFSNLQIDMSTRMLARKVGDMGLVGAQAMGSTKAVGSQAVMLGDTTQGFASFVMPGIFVLILQQSLILGVVMLAGGRAERRRRGLVAETEPLPAMPTVIGRMLCYLTIYAPLVLYIFTIMPWAFSLPSVGNLGEYVIYVLPMLIGASFLGMTLGIFVTERETSMVLIVFTSVIFLFLSGLTWPRYAMGPFWHTVSDMVPATWGVDGFVRMASDGASLAEQRTPWLMMWLLAAIYFVPAWLITRYHRHTARLLARRPKP